MILSKYINAAVQSALGEGVRIDVKTKDEKESPKKEEFRYGVDDPTGHVWVSTEPPEPIEIDKYKVPFFFVTGVLIGVAFGLRHGKVVVLR